MTRGVATSLVAFLCCYVELCVGMDYTPLEGDAIYEFSWAGSSSAARAEDVAFRTTITEESDDVTRLLANELLAPGFTDEVVEMATAQQEKYTCVLPKSPTAEFEEEEEVESKYLTPESLLQPLQFQCLKLSQGYWSYELCHGQILRQYHEENTGKGIKMDEYILGKARKSSFGDTSEENEEKEDGEEEGEKRKIPTWHFSGFDYPYHKVDMTGGAPCDLRGNNPRSVSILYMCQTDAQTYGSLLLVEESTACHYVAIVGSKQLCQNKDFRLKEQPVYTISCYSEGSSPKKPGILREQEFDIISMTTKTPTVSDTAKTSSKGGTPGSKVSSSGTSPGPSLDEAIILTFLTGEMCLRGGSGWWIHELCLMKQVKQIHQEVDISETDVLLGVWNEDDHRSVTHLYKGGDVCDITGKPRVCYVKFKSTKCV